MLALLLASCGSPQGGVARSGELPLLGGRLVTRAPAGATEDVGPSSIMGAPQPDVLQCRLSWEHEGTRVVALFTQLFLLCGEDLGSTALAMRSGASPGDAELRPLTSRGGIQGIAVLPREPRRGGGYVEPLRAYLCAPGGTLVLARFLVAGDGPAASTRAQGLAVLESLAPGPTPFPIGARTLSLPTYVPDHPIRIHVGDGFASVSREGPDFRAHHVTFVAATPEEPRGGMTIYVGDHPSSMGIGEEIRGPLFGREIPWQRTEPEPGYVRVDYSGPSPRPTGTRFIHVRYGANDGALLDRLRSIVESAELP